MTRRRSEWSDPEPDLGMVLAEARPQASPVVPPGALALAASLACDAHKVEEGPTIMRLVVLAARGPSRPPKLPSALDPVDLEPLAAFACDAWQIPSGPVYWRLGVLLGLALGRK